MDRADCVGEAIGTITDEDEDEKVKENPPPLKNRRNSGATNVFERIEDINDFYEFVLEQEAKDAENDDGSNLAAKVVKRRRTKRFCA